MALSDIDRAAVLRAIEEFDGLGRDAFLGQYGFGRSRTYFLRHGGKLYDSKAILGVAHVYLGGGRSALTAGDFSGGEATVAQTLRYLGFEVQVSAVPSVPATPLGNVSPEGFAFWWVNNRKTYAHEIGGNYLWSPTTQSDGRRSEFYENMKRLRAGDVVFAFAGGEVKAVGMCSAPASLAPKPGEFGVAGKAWSTEGWRVPVEFTRLSTPLRPKDHMAVLAPTLPAKYSPIKPDGKGNEAYLAAVPVKMAQVVIDLLGARWAEVDFGSAIEPVRQVEAVAEAEDQVEQGLRNRTDLGETEKLQLVRARRGQGVYRQNLESFENACRITGVINMRHLRASHIKPWRASTTYEKFDGNNGLLLSPHIDHLFDQGFISFADNGALLVSSQADVDTLLLWRIELDRSCQPFRPEQLSYLAFHREFVFKR